MRQSWKASLKQVIPPSLLNAFLLRFPLLYRTKLVFYETNLQGGGGIEELLNQMTKVLDVEGDIIECGSSRCGTSIIMANYLRACRVEKRVLACDSFEGFDLSELEREQKSGMTTAQCSDFTSTSYRYVQKKIAALRLQDTVIPIKGYFRVSLPPLSGPFCLALIDCDLRESILYSAETIWSKLSKGGRILFDDYLDPEFRGAKQAVDTFVGQHRAELSEHGLLNRLYYGCKA